ncbi:MAG: hypothetical protein KKE20_00500 [Nanoarchaeota archaeon]|nr:hypothetical protein [Nanoarchaeota archaeon]
MLDNWSIKERLAGFAGLISTGLGGIGAILAEIGLCGCVLTPILSVLGAVSVVMGFVTEHKIALAITGTSLLMLSIVSHRSKINCKVHRKRKI